jgi:ankyrin repeat protein
MQHHEIQKILSIYQNIADNNYDNFMLHLENHDLKWLNSFVTSSEVLYMFDYIFPMELAINVGNEDIVFKLLEMGENPNKNNYFENAIIKGNRNIVGQLINAGAVIQINNNELLSLAAERGNLDIVKLLIEKGIDVNGYDRDYLWLLSHPLVRSIANGHIDIYQYLLDLTYVDKDTLNILAIQEVARRGDIKTLSFLIDNGLDINSQDYFYKATPLMIAISENQWSMTDYLIDMGVNIDAQDFEGQTALMIAVTNGSITMIKKILAARASKDLRDINNNTALELAIARKDRATIKLLERE